MATFQKIYSKSLHYQNDDKLEESNKLKALLLAGMMALNGASFVSAKDKINSLKPQEVNLEINKQFPNHISRKEFENFVRFFAKDMGYDMSNELDRNIAYIEAMRICNQNGTHIEGVSVKNLNESIGDRNMDSKVNNSLSDEVNKNVAKELKNIISDLKDSGYDNEKIISSLESAAETFEIGDNQLALMKADAVANDLSDDDQQDYADAIWDAVAIINQLQESTKSVMDTRFSKIFEVCSSKK